MLILIRCILTSLVAGAQVSKSTVGLYAYATDSELKRDDIAKLKVNNGKYYRAHQWKLSAQSVTAMSCINSVQSPLLFCATSDRYCDQH